MSAAYNALPNQCLFTGMLLAKPSASGSLVWWEVSGIKSSGSYGCLTISTYSVDKILKHDFIRSGSGWQWADDLVDPISGSIVRIGSIGIACGTKTGVGEGTSKTAVRLFTSSEIDDLFGVTGSNQNNTSVFVSNGDGEANEAHIDGCTLTSGVWKATADRSVSTTIRINYAIVRWNL